MGTIVELRSVTCHMGSHSVTCHPTQVNAPHLNPSHADRYSIYLPQRDGRLTLVFLWQAGKRLTVANCTSGKPSLYLVSGLVAKLKMLDL